MQKFAQVEQIKKPCSVCGETKSLSCYSKSKTGKDGYKNKCNACVNLDRNKKDSEVDVLLNELMQDPEARELMESLDGLGDDM